MGRGDPSPVAVPVRDFGNEGRGGFPTRVSWCRGNEGDKAGHCCHCNQEECEVFHKGSSIQCALCQDELKSPVLPIRLKADVDAVRPPVARRNSRPTTILEILPT